MTGQFSVCKRPGCGKPLPVSHGPGRARQFCSPECARRYHNDARAPAPRAALAEPADPFLTLESLVRQLSATVRAIRERAADAGQQIESLNAALAQTQEELRATRAELERRAAGSPDPDAGQPLRVPIFPMNYSKLYGLAGLIAVCKARFRTLLSHAAGMSESRGLRKDPSWDCRGSRDLCPAGAPGTS